MRVSQGAAHGLRATRCRLASAGLIPKRALAYRALALSSMVLLLSCATISPRVLCTDGNIRVDVSFEGAGNHACSVLARGQFVLTVEPEGRPINPSPWYAFRVRAAAASDVAVTLRYLAARHRYEPKISTDAASWRRLEQSGFVENTSDNSATFQVSVERGSTFIAAQPIETPAAARAWGRRALLPAAFHEVQYGRSIEGRPLVAFVTGDGADLLIAMTRQHPPETQGAVAFRAFAERLAGDDPGARRVRMRSRIVLAPMPNPDGVARGHWRNNAGGVDLNRDWGSFSQPETRALAALIVREATGRNVRAFIDFHATHRNVIYAPPRETPSPDMAFLTRLEVRFQAARTNPPAWEYDHRANSGVAKAWALEALGAPGITLEVADDASEHEARALGRDAADALIEHINGG